MDSLGSLRATQVGEEALSLVQNRTQNSIAHSICHLVLCVVTRTLCGIVFGIVIGLRSFQLSRNNAKTCSYVTSTHNLSVSKTLCHASFLDFLRVASIKLNFQRSSCFLRV